MDDGRPAFELVVPGSVKNVSGADGDGGTRCFNRGEGGMIIHHIVVEKNFFTAAAAHIQRGRIVQRARRAYAGKEPDVRGVPKAMFRLRTSDG